MNKKQLIVMWLGIGVIILFAFVRIVDTYRPDYAYFAVWVLLVVLVAGGLIYTFRDKKRQEGEKTRRINLTRGFRRITLVSAIIAAVFCAFYAGAIPSRKYHAAQTRLKECKYETYMAYIRADPNISVKPGDYEAFGDTSDLPEPSSEQEFRQVLATIDSHAEEVERTKLLKDGFSDKEIDDYFQEKFRTEKKKTEIELKELETGFWVNLSQGSLIGLCILAGLGGAAAGYGGVWFVYFLIWLVYRFIRWLVMGFYDVNRES
ncbi:MAG TPA: hypothetical protein HPP87_13930 [Planctomycetes bacterium]|nr:hypothetical protein [Planctomycetota bacterium]HIJ72436.1 hypothetical protein [Planctomycetota bacterium]